MREHCEPKGVPLAETVYTEPFEPDPDCTGVGIRSCREVSFHSLFIFPFYLFSTQH